MQSKRLLLGLFLCFLLLWVHTLLFPPPKKPLQEPTPAVETEDGVLESDRASAEDPVIEDETDLIEEPSSLEQAPASGSFEATHIVSEEEVTVETGIYRAVFSNRGAVLKSLKIKTLYNDSEVQKDPAKMDDPDFWFEILGEVRENTPSFLLKGITSGKTDRGYSLDEALWERESSGMGGGTQRVAFILKTADGLVFRKTFSFHEEDYHIEVGFEVRNRDPDRKETLNLVMEGISGISDRKRAAFTMPPTAIIQTLAEGETGPQRELLANDADGLKNKPFDLNLKKAELEFAGLETNYFALLLKPLDGSRVRIRQVILSALENSEHFREGVEEFRKKYNADPRSGKLAELHSEAVTNVSAGMRFAVTLPPPGEAAYREFMFFAGPKDAELIRQEPYDIFYPLIEKSYGKTFAWINKSLIWILKLFYSLVGNWGFAIILLTFVVKGILYPLNRTQQVSMNKYSQKMGKLKPKLDELKKKFKNNKKKYNEAQMKLMKEHGVSPPLMGCLLIFLQFPVFIGLFQVLRTSFELRHSSFCFWIKDLSMPDALPIPFSLPLVGDTLNVLPLLMTLAFFFQQKMMPKPADPQAQQTQKMMMFMPFFFLFILYNYASGLSLYWMTSNLITIVEYKVIRKKFPVAGTAGAESAVNTKPAARTKPVVKTKSSAKSK